MSPLDPISYNVRFPDAARNFAEISASFPVPDASRVELSMAVWTPGSYLIREYSRHLDRVRARTSGTPEGSSQELPIRKLSKNRWEVECGDAKRITVDYRVFGHEMSVRANWIEEGFALINGAPTFLTLTEDLMTDSPVDRVHEIEISLPEGWETVVTSLPAVDAESTRFRAANFDELVDSPFLAGCPHVDEFEAGDRNHVVAHEGGGGIWDEEASSRDVAKIVETQQAFWGTVPYERYVFFNLITESGGGLEHKDNCVLMTSRWKYRRRESYLDWLGLVSHEFFHTWNVKRLRPIELGPFDYENENYSRSLWVAEGVTNYYTDMLVLRAGLCSETEYLEKLSKFFERLHRTPGRLEQTLEESSFDAWIKLYRPDENSANSGISYYVKGAVVAFLLDVEIKRHTEDAKCLDDVLRESFQRYSGDRGFQGEEFCALASEIAEHDLTSWFDRALRSTEDLSYEGALDYLGLRFRDSERKKASPPAAWVGIGTRVDDEGRLMIRQVRTDSPAAQAGLNVHDEILAIDDFRIEPRRWEKRLKQYSPGDRVRFLLARRQSLRTIEVELGTKPDEKWKLECDPECSPEAEKRRATWLSAPNQGASEE
ncbi:MAG: PDZ domain-containing protein [Planctomycetota bacterium]